jgi:arsenate reductase
MAEGFARSWGKGMLEAHSAGSRPADSVNPWAVLVMNEKGIDLSRCKPKGTGVFEGQSFDWVVSMGCRDTCPMVEAKNFLEWKIPDPRGEDLRGFRRIRDEIENEVKEFIDKIVGKEATAEEDHGKAF